MYIPASLEKSYESLRYFLKKELTQALQNNQIPQILVGEQHFGIAELASKILIVAAATKLGFRYMNIETTTTDLMDELEYNPFIQFLANNELCVIRAVDEYEENLWKELESYRINGEHVRYYKAWTQFIDIRNSNMIKNGNPEMPSVYFVGLGHLPGMEDKIKNKNCYPIKINVSQLSCYEALEQTLNDSLQEEDQSTFKVELRKMYPALPDCIASKTLFHLKLDEAIELPEDENQLLENYFLIEQKKPRALFRP